jgi:hypothetical protein
VYRRERSKRWQAAFSIDGKPIRISTGKKDLNEAKEIARDTYLEYKFRHKNDLPVITKKFSDAARLAIADMRKQLDAGLGKKVYADYIVCIERYLIPYFGAQYVTSIDYEQVQSFYEWHIHTLFFLYEILDITGVSGLVRWLAETLIYTFLGLVIGSLIAVLRQARTT